MITVSDLYHEVEDDILSVIDLTNFLIESLDQHGGISEGGAAGMQRVLTVLRERADGIKGEFLNAIGPQ